MSLTQNLATHFDQVNNGGNWSLADYKSTLQDVSWSVATKKIGNCNTILDLVFHIDYYVAGTTIYLEGGSLDIRDKFSFDHKIKSADEWEAFKTKLFHNAERLRKLYATLEDDQLQQPFEQEKYGTYFRNILGLIEHHHYHLGQIVILKKLITSQMF